MQTNKLSSKENHKQKFIDSATFNTIWLGYCHILGTLGFFLIAYNYDKLSKILPVFFTQTCILGLGVTAGAHRLWAHKSYQASLPLKIFLMIANSGTILSSIFVWSRDHRLHHKFADTPLDPHDMSKGFFYAHVGWLLQKKSPQLVEEGKKIDVQDLKKDKVVMFQKKYYLYLAMLFGFIIPICIYNHFTGMPYHHCFLIIMFRYCYMLNGVWCVNSVCHMFGSRPWNKNIQPTDNYFVSLITYGQGYHNWHHEYPSDWRASKDEWYMINITARFIQLCSYVGLATVKA